jgi:hypothetical protein
MYSKLLWTKNDKDPLKDLKGEIDFNELNIAFSSYGGPIAITKKIEFDDMKTSSPDSKLFDFKQYLRVYSAVGKLIFQPINVYIILN